MTRRSDRLAPGALAAYLEGEVTPSEAAATEAHLRDSGRARRELAQLDDIRRTLARWPDELDEATVDPAALWQARETPAAARGGRPRRWSAPIWAAMGAVAGAAIAVLVLTRGAPSATPGSSIDSRGAPAAAPGSKIDPPGGRPAAPPAGPPGASEMVAQAEFRAKNAAVTPADDRWVHIDVLEVDRDGAARQRGELRTGAPLVLRYASGGPDPFGFLMVFAVDAAAQLHWYYPAYEAAGADPRSIAIERDGRVRPLPDAIEHDLPAGPLVFYAIFSRAPLRVLDVERAMAEQITREGWDPEHPARAPLPGTGQHVVRETVAP
jgi:hypothetical protein